MVLRGSPLASGSGSSAMTSVNAVRPVAINNSSPQLQASGQPVVGLVSDQFLLEPGGGGLGVDGQEFDAELPGRSPRTSMPTAVLSTVRCGAPAVSQDSTEVRQLGRWLACPVSAAWSE